MRSKSTRDYLFSTGPLVASKVAAVKFEINLVNVFLLTGAYICKMPEVQLMKFKPFSKKNAGAKLGCFWDLNTYQKVLKKFFVLFQKCLLDIRNPS